MQLGHRVVSPFVLALSLGIAVAPTPGCIGKFALTQKVYEFNRGVSNSIVVQEIVFLAFLVVPVYEITTFVDAFVLNVIEAINGGENPVGAVEGDHQIRTVQLGPDRTLRVERRGDALRTELISGDRSERVRVIEHTATGLEVRDGSGELLAAAKETGTGDLEIVDGAGRTMATWSHAQVLLATEAYLAGGAQALEDQVRALDTEPILYAIR